MQTNPFSEETRARAGRYNRAMKKAFLLLATGLATLAAGRLRAQPAPAAGPASAPLRINVNTASREQLMTLPGIGESEARRIVAGRPYGNLPQFERKAGLSAAALQRIRARVVFVRSEPEETRPTPPPVQRPVNPAGEWSPAPAPAPLPYDQKVDVNTASREELAAKAHLDPMTAMRILRGRPYASLADLKKVGFAEPQILKLSRYAKVVAAPQK